MRISRANELRVCSFRRDHPALGMGAVRSVDIPMSLVPSNELRFGITLFQWRRRQSDPFEVETCSRLLNFSQQTRTNPFPATLRSHENFVQNEIVNIGNPVEREEGNFQLV